MPKCLICGGDNTWSDDNLVDAFLKELEIREKKKWCVSDPGQRCCSLVCVSCCTYLTESCAFDAASCGKCRQKMNVWIAVNIPADKIKGVI